MNKPIIRVTICTGVIGSRISRGVSGEFESGNNGEVGLEVGVEVDSRGGNIVS